MEVSNDILSLTGIERDKRWNIEAPLGTSVVVTYSFPKKQNSYDSGDRPGFKGFSEAHIVHIEKALKTWEAAGGVSFVRVPAKVGGDIQMAMFDMTGHLNAVGNQVSGWGYYPQYKSVHSDGQLDTGQHPSEPWRRYLPECHVLPGFGRLAGAGHPWLSHRPTRDWPCAWLQAPVQRRPDHRRGQG